MVAAAFACNVVFAANAIVARSFPKGNPRLAPATTALFLDGRFAFTQPS